MTDLESIKKTLVNISKGNDILDTLLEFERTLDNAEIFAYKNWILGEIVEGPDISRYWYKVTLMYPYHSMPDPDAGLRLTKIGAKVSFRKGTFTFPVKVKGPEDWIDPESKRAKLKNSQIWLVTIELPIKFINRGLENSEEIIKKDIEKSNAELSQAYDDMDETGEMDEMGDLDAEMPVDELPTEDMQ